MRQNGRGQPTAAQYDALLADHADLRAVAERLEACVPRRFEQDGRTTLTADGETWVLKAESRGFPELVEVLRAIVEHDFPEKLFNGSPEPASRLIADLRSALRRFDGTVATNGDRPGSGMAEIQWAVFKFRERWSKEVSNSKAVARFEKSDRLGIWFFSCFTGIDAIQRAYTAEVERLKREGHDLDGADALYVAVPLEGQDQVQIQMTGSWQADAEILKVGSRRPAASVT